MTWPETARCSRPYKVTAPLATKVFRIDTQPACFEVALGSSTARQDAIPPWPPLGAACATSRPDSQSLSEILGIGSADAQPHASANARYFSGGPDWPVAGWRTNNVPPPGACNCPAWQKRHRPGSGAGTLSYSSAQQLLLAPHINRQRRKRCRDGASSPPDQQADLSRTADDSRSSRNACSRPSAPAPLG